MQKRRSFYLIFSIFFIFAILIFCFSIQGWLHVSIISRAFAPLQMGVFQTTQKMLPQDAKNNHSQERTNQKLVAALESKKLQEDAVALRDQFATTVLPSRHLLPAHIVGEPGFLQGKTAVEELVIDQGAIAGVKKGMVVVYKNNLVGTIWKTTDNFSQVLVMSNKKNSFSAKTLKTSAIGVIKGQGHGDIILDNVLLNQNLKLHDIVETSGDQNVQGEGYPPHLVVGEIIGIEKDPSALFQKGNIESLIDSTRLTMVFVLLQK